MSSVMERRGYEINIEEGRWRIVTYPRHYTYLEHKCTKYTWGGRAGAGLADEKLRWDGDWKVLTFWDDCCGQACIHCGMTAPDGMQAAFMFLKADPQQAEKGWT